MSDELVGRVYWHHCLVIWIEKGNVHSRNSLFSAASGSLKRSISLAYYICATSKTSAGEACCLLLCPAEWTFMTMEWIPPLRLERCFGVSHGNHMHFHSTTNDLFLANIIPRYFPCPTQQTSQYWNHSSKSPVMSATWSQVSGWLYYSLVVFWQLCAGRVGKGLCSCFQYKCFGQIFT